MLGRIEAYPILSRIVPTIQRYVSHGQYCTPHPPEWANPLSGKLKKGWGGPTRFGGVKLVRGTPPGLEGNPTRVWGGQPGLGDMIGWKGAGVKCQNESKYKY